MSSLKAYNCVKKTPRWLGVMLGVLACGMADASNPGNQFPTQLGPYEGGNTLEYWSAALGYSLPAPIDANSYLYVDCAAGCTGGGGGAVTAAAGSYADGALVTLGTKADSAYTGSGSASEIAIQKAIYQELLVGGSGALPLYVTPQDAFTPVVGTATSAAVLSNFPVTTTSGYNSGVVDFTSVGTGNTVVVEGLIANGQYDTILSIVSPVANVAYPFSSAFESVRVRVSTYGSGTVTAQLAMKPSAGELGLAVPQGSNTAGQNGVLTQGAAVSAAPTITAGQTVPLEINSTTGALNIGSMDGAQTGTGVTSGTASVVPACRFVTSITPISTGSYILAQCNSYGAEFDDNEGLKPSDSSWASFTPASGVLWDVCGSSTKTIKIRSLLVSGTAGTAGTYNLELIKTSTAPSGGTSAALTFVPDNTVSTSNTASGAYYTAAPTAGTAVGGVGGALVPFVTAGSAQVPVQMINQGAPSGTQSITLVGTSQCLEISTATAALTTPTMVVSEIHTEE